MTIHDIITMDIKDLIKETDTALGTETIVVFAIFSFPDIGCIASGRVEKIRQTLDPKLYNAEVISWSVEGDLQDVDTIIVRIEI